MKLMISNGDDTQSLRDIAADVARNVQHLFTYELGRPIAITEWDYRRDSPRVVPTGHLAVRSLSMVEESECVLAIFGPTVPPITSKEITRVFERRKTGHVVDLWLFLNPEQKTAVHEEFLEGIQTRFGEEIVYSPYKTELAFQARAMTTLVAHIFNLLARRAGEVTVDGDA